MKSRIIAMVSDLVFAAVNGIAGVYGLLLAGFGLVVHISLTNICIALVAGPLGILCLSRGIVLAEDVKDAFKSIRKKPEDNLPEL